MTHTLRIALLVVLAAALAAFSMPGMASAHPMGQFSINRYSALTVRNDSINILYIVDMAEIPTFQELGAIRSDHSTDLTEAERQAYISQKSEFLVQGLSLQVDGTPIPLKLSDTSLTFPLGTGGLPTLRFELNLRADLDGLSSGAINYQDSNYTDRIGWREVIAVPAEGTKFNESSVPQVDQTAKLTVYNANATSNTLNVTGATLTFAPGIAPAPSAQTPASNEGVVDWAKQRVEDVAALISQENLSFGAMLVGLLIAFFWGAGHALSPGHGKAVVAAYLVGTRGTAKHAALLGLTVTISHTIGVFALGFIVLFAANFIVPDVLYPIIGFISGLMIVVMGIVMFAQRFRAWRASRAGLDQSHDHSHEAGEEHDHADNYDPTVPHSHGPFSKPHTHAPAAEGKMGIGGLLTLGITGGIIPCPTALVVLLAAVAYHRVALGLAWIFAFSLGLAAVLTGLGLLVVYGKSFISRFDRSRLKFGTGIMARLPMASALVVAVLGFLIAFQSLAVR